MAKRMQALRDALPFLSRPSPMRQIMPPPSGATIPEEKREVEEKEEVEPEREAEREAEREPEREPELETTLGIPKIPAEGYYEEVEGVTFLQKHVSFWDRKKKGVFYPWDTYNGCRALGFNSIFSLSYALAFHLLHASYWTSNSWFLNPLLPVYVDRIHRAKHGSDTGSYDHDGHFRIQALEENFKKYDKDKKDAFTYGDLCRMMYGNRCAGDLLGWSFQFFLWSGLWLLAADRRGRLHKKDILRHYNGSLYYEIERRRKLGEKLPIWRFGALW